MKFQFHKLSKDDLGFENRTDRGRKRTVNHDGSLNVVRKNHFREEFHIYQWAITCKWSTYWLVVLLIYILANLFFASLYYLTGADQIVGTEGSGVHPFWQCYFFSLQTFTTVGYGGLHPRGLLTNTIAGLEAFLGLMTFALATGALYGRFSRPVSSIKYSPNILIAPFKEGKALMLMLCNNKKGNLANVEAKLNFSWIDEDPDGKPIRRYTVLDLDIPKISMLALSWTLVHPIDENSILSQFSESDFTERDVEVFVMISAYDDTFAQTVNSRNSYLGSEFVFNARFLRPFFTDENGNTVLDVVHLGAYEKLGPSVL